MNIFAPRINSSQMHTLGILAIAQVGDAVFELMVRTRLCVSQPTAAKLHRARVKYVNAAAQAGYLARLEPLLTESELDVVRRGRNAMPGNVPKAATREEYAAATGLEALWGHLYLTGECARLSQLFEVIWND